MTKPQGKLAAFGIGLGLLLAACAAPPNQGGLPPPIAGVDLSGEPFSGATTVRATVVGQTVFGPLPLAGSVDVTQEADGSFTAEVAFTFDDSQEMMMDFSGDNDGGTVEVPIMLVVCGEAFTATLEGTINPADTINFGEATHEGLCFGEVGTLVIEAFEMKR